MNESLLTAIAVAVAVIGGVAIVAILAARHAAKRRELRAHNVVALSHELNGSVLDTAAPRLRGMAHGRGFSLAAVASGKNRFALMRVSMLVGSGIRLEIQPRASSATAAALDDIRTGDGPLDAVAVIRSDRREAALRILTPTVRAGLIELAAREKGFRLAVHEREGTLDWDGDFASSEKCARVARWVELLAQVADNCEHEAGR